jgi:hypothetical protein
MNDVGLLYLIFLIAFVYYNKDKFRVSTLVLDMDHCFFLNFDNCSIR